MSEETTTSVEGGGFTPGPWEIDRDPRPHMEWNIEVMAHPSTRTICFMAHNGLRANEANAHLIAAAPDLLAALEAVVRAADRATVEFGAARAAIRKARGLPNDAPLHAQPQFKRKRKGASK